MFNSSAPIVNLNGTPYMGEAERNAFESFQQHAMNGTATISINKILIRESGTYNNQYSRTYQADTSPWQLRTFTDHLLLL